ncbi:MAG: hypothetical protein C0467_18615 [Planctomycetaceae bacterium]|nr:hypothetical protein [Planctomycetaceae bacterium]
MARPCGGDEAKLMAAILDSTLPSHTEPISVRAVISDSDLYALHRAALESYGVVLLEGGPGARRSDLSRKRYLFLEQYRIRLTLLRGTPWSDLDCDQLLRRLPCAKSATKCLSGGMACGVQLPLSDWATPA